MRKTNPRRTAPTAAPSLQRPGGPFGSLDKCRASVGLIPAEANCFDVASAPLEDLDETMSICTSRMSRGCSRSGRVVRVVREREDHANRAL